MLTFGLILVTLIGGFVLTYPDVSAVALLAILWPIAIFVPILFHPTAKTLWVAIDLLMNPLEPGEALGGPEERSA